MTCGNGIGSTPDLRGCPAPCDGSSSNISHGQAAGLLVCPPARVAEHAVDSHAEAMFQSWTTGRERADCDRNEPHSLNRRSDDTGVVSAADATPGIAARS